jgi:hypothetical protein
MHRFIPIGFLAFLLSCSTSNRPATGPLVGRWSTGCSMGQLGPSMTRYTFRSDYTFDVSFTAWFLCLRLGRSGTYVVEGDRLLLQTPHKTNEIRFSFDGDDLVLKERLKTFRLHRIGRAE